MSHFVEAGRLDELAPGMGKLVIVEGNHVALFNVDGTVFAISDHCIHAGKSLSGGKLDGKFVTCSGHGWQYDVTTGATTCVKGLRTDAYAVRIDDGTIMVDVD